MTSREFKKIVKTILEEYDKDKIQFKSNPKKIKEKWDISWDKSEGYLDKEDKKDYEEPFLITNLKFCKKRADKYFPKKLNEAETENYVEHLKNIDSIISNIIDRYKNFITILEDLQKFTKEFKH